jgi:tRNA 2-selenouridine synthase
MREPFKCPVEQTVNQLERFDEIIDVRAPIEFAQDHLPGAINLPVLTDQQRHDVGLAHKERGAFAGSLLGAPMVSNNIAHLLETVLANKPREWRPLIYCWRGGQRSAALATVLARVGWRTTLLEGGYQAFRRHVCDYFEKPLPPWRFIVLAGRTGTAKSLVLNHLARCGEQVLDLEALANHKGSVLGQIPDSPQPSQRQFETRLWHQLVHMDRARPIFVEAESKKVGVVHIPDQLMNLVRAAEPIFVRASLDWRADYLLQDYHYFTQDHDGLFRQLDCLTSLHSHEVITQWKSIAREPTWHQFVKTVLSAHYDPAYDRAIGKNYLTESALPVIELIGQNVQLASQTAAKTILAHLRR